jgi:hypothetical protein
MRVDDGNASAVRDGVTDGVRVGVTDGLAVALGTCGGAGGGGSVAVAVTPAFGLGRVVGDGAVGGAGVVVGWKRAPVRGWVKATPAAKLATAAHAMCRALAGRAGGMRR